MKFLNQKITYLINCIKVTADVYSFVIFFFLFDINDGKGD